MVGINQGNTVNRKIKYAVAVAMALGLSGCAQQAAQMVRPTAAQLQALEPLSVVEVVSQDNLAAQDTFTAANVNIMPSPGVPILVGAAGGALGMALVNAGMKAEARHFAEAHVLPLRAALQGFDAKSTLASSLQLALAKQPAQFAGYTVAAVAPVSAPSHLVVQTSYSMTPDFSALQVIANVSISGNDVRQDKPVYHNVLVYQTSRQTLPLKTTQDSERMLAQENRRYAALHVDMDIAKANAEIEQRDLDTVRLRQKIDHEQIEHRAQLARAGASGWDADSRASRLAEKWAANQGVALKVAMRSSGAEIAHMLELDLADQVAPGGAEEPHTIFSDDTREISYLSGGHMISQAKGDGDASLKKLSPLVTVPVSVPGHH